MKISIIMPAYNAAKSIGRAIESVLLQDYTDFELIVINDASTDDTLKIVQKYKELDNRIIVLNNQLNLGVSETRNHGLKVVKGDYIWFIDADDYVEKNLLSNAVRVIADYNAELVKFGYFEEYYDRKGTLNLCNKKSVSSFHAKSNLEVLEKAFVLWENIGLGFLWNTIVKTSIVSDNKIIFDKNLKANEDFKFVFNLIRHVNSFSYIDFCPYHYVKMPEGSITTSKLDTYYNDNIFKIEYFYNLYREEFLNDKLKKDIIVWEYTRVIYSTLERNIDKFYEYYGVIRQNNLHNQLILKENTISELKKKILITILRSQNTKLIMIVVSLISMVKKYTPIFFAKIKN